MPDRAEAGIVASGDTSLVTAAVLVVPSEAPAGASADQDVPTSEFRDQGEVAGKGDNGVVEASGARRVEEVLAGVLRLLRQLEVRANQTGE